MATDVKDYRSLLREIQNSTTTIYSTLPSEEPRFLIDINSRTINVPSEFGFLAIENDHNSQKVYFEIDRFFDGIDLAEHTCIIQFINIEKTKTSSNERPKPNVGKCPNKCLNTFPVNVPPVSEPKKVEGYFVVTEMDIESIEDKIVFEWKVENRATSLAGDIFFSVRFYSIDDLEEFVYNFNTLPAHSLILDTLDVINGSSSMDSSEIEVLLTKFKDFKNEIDAKVDIAQGTENHGKILAINESGDVEAMSAPASTDVTYSETEQRLVFSSKTNLAGNVGVDSTLSVSGDAADAKVVGDKFEQLKEEIKSLNIVNTVMTDDGNGNVTLSLSSASIMTDDGYGNITFS